jgi:hypothetical protein
VCQFTHKGNKIWAVHLRIASLHALAWATTFAIVIAVKLHVMPRQEA